MIRLIIDMGFDEASAREALRASKNHQSYACEWLVGNRSKIHQTEQIDGLPLDSPILKALLASPHVQMSLSSPKMFIGKSNRSFILFFFVCLFSFKHESFFRCQRICRFWKIIQRWACGWVTAKRQASLATFYELIMKRNIYWQSINLMQPICVQINNDHCVVSLAFTISLTWENLLPIQLNAKHGTG